MCVTSQILLEIWTRPPVWIRGIPLVWMYCWPSPVRYGTQEYQHVTPSPFMHFGTIFAWGSCCCCGIELRLSAHELMYVRLGAEHGSMGRWRNWAMF